MAIDYAKRVKSQEDILSPRTKRFDEDWGKWLQDKFEMKTLEGQKMPNVRPVTLNDDRTFAERILSVLDSAEPTLEVFGADGKNMPDKEAAIFEQLWQAILYDINRRLGLRGLGSLHPTLVMDSSHKGWIVTRPLVWSDNGVARFDILPGDPRWTTFEWGDNGLDWGAIKTTISGTKAAEKYPRYKGSAKEVVVTDYEDKEFNVILVNTQVVEEIPNKIGYPRFVITPVGELPPRGRTSEEAIRDHGESIFAPNRNYSNYKNELATLGLTLAYLAAKPPTGIRSESGTEVPTEEPFTEGKVTPLGLQGGFEGFPFGNIQEAAMFLWGVIDPGYQRGGLSYVDWGNPPFELSAVALESLKADRDQVFIPRMKALVAVYRDTYHMLLDQFVKGGRAAEIGGNGQTIKFSPSDFKGDYSVKFGMRTVSPERDLGSAAIATGVSRYFSDEDVIRTVFKVANPEEMMARKRNDTVVGLMPELLLLQVWKDKKALAKEAVGDEKKDLEKEADLIEMKLDSLLAPPQPPEVPQGAPSRGPEGSTAAVAGPGVPPPRLMAAQEQVQRETARRKGVVLGREGV